MSRIAGALARFEKIDFKRKPDLKLRLPERWFETLNRIKQMVPLEPGIITEWMQKSSAEMDLLMTMAVDYPASGIQAISGDAWSPGMVISEYYSILQTGPGLKVFRNPKIGEIVAEVPLFRKRWDNYKQLLVMYMQKYNSQNRAIFNFFDKFARLPSIDSVRIPTFLAGDGTPLTPSLPYSFQLARPALRTAFSFDAQLPEESKLKVNLWDTSRRTVAESTEVVLPAGGHTVVATFRNPGMLAGHMEIDPTYAKQGLTIANLKSSPVSI